MKKRYILLLLIAYSITLYITFDVLFVRYNKKLNLENKVLKTSSNDKVIQNINSYNIDVTFNPNKNSLNVKQITDFINNTGTQLNYIHFNFYPNAITSQNKKGSVKFNNIKANDDNIKYTLTPNSNTLKIELDEPLPNGSSIEIEFDYIINLPDIEERLGFGKDTYNFGNWYPILSVFDDSWYTHDYTNIGDPFFSEIANYKVSITTPKDYIVATSGEILSKYETSEYTVWDIKGDSLREFAWVASKNFTMYQDVVDGIDINLYITNKNKNLASKIMKSTKTSISTFNNIFGRYPYAKFNVVSTNMVGGMEYPNIVFINEQFFNTQYTERLSRIITHEVAHQWWYSAVGNNQIEEAWLDEGLATFSEYLYTKYLYDNNEGTNYYSRFIKGYYLDKKQYLTNDEIILKPIDKFTSRLDYSSLVYRKSAMFLKEIEDDYGSKVMLDILKTYYDKYKFKTATSRNFIDVCESITGDDFDKRFNKWFYNR